MDVEIDVVETEQQMLTESFRTRKSLPIDRQGSLGELALGGCRPNCATDERPQGAGEMVDQVAFRQGSGERHSVTRADSPGRPHDRIHPHARKGTGTPDIEAVVSSRGLESAIVTR